MVLTAQTTKDLKTNLNLLDQRIYELEDVQGSDQEVQTLSELRAATAGVLGVD